MPRAPKKKPAGTDAAAVRLHASALPTIPLAQIQPYDRNARTHDQAQIDALKVVIRDSGFTAPILLDEQDRLIAGHGRLEAARQLGMPELPYVRVSGLTEDQVRRLRLSDNTLAARSGWDFDALKAELGDIATDALSFSLTGFDLGEAAGMGLLDDLPQLRPDPGDPIGEPPPSAYDEQFGVVVICKDEADQKAAYEKLRDQGYQTKVVKV